MWECEQSDTAAALCRFDMYTCTFYCASVLAVLSILGCVYSTSAICMHKYGIACAANFMPCQLIMRSVLSSDHVVSSAQAAAAAVGGGAAAAG
jgi:hypothetical protein